MHHQPPPPPLPQSSWPKASPSAALQQPPGARCPHPPINKVLTSLSSVEGRAIETSASQSLGCALTLQNLLLLLLSSPRRCLEHPSLVHPDAPRSMCHLLACDR